MPLNRVKSPNKSAIIIGVTGQDGSYLSEYLLDQGYYVMGVKRRSSTDTLGRLMNVISNPHFKLVEGDITDYASMSGIFTQATELYGGAPHEVYNLAAQSHVGTSFNQPLATWDSTAQGVLNVLEVMRQGHYLGTTRFYQASTSEMFGDNFELQEDGSMIQTEETALSPCSPYGVAKTAAHQAVQVYREAYGLFGCCGILFNHESPRRGENFVTRKISLYVANLAAELQWRRSVTHDLPPPAKLGLGNLAAARDWGHAKDYVRAMHMMLQHDKADDYIVATGEAHTVKEFCAQAFGGIGQNYEDWVYADPQFMRPYEVPYLQGRPDKIKTILGWEPQVTFLELVDDMVTADIDAVRGSCCCQE